MSGIIKLNGMDHYNDRKFTMKMLLMHEKLWSCAVGAVAAADLDTEGTAALTLFACMWSLKFTLM
jgi:hypothetical protein